MSRGAEINYYRPTKTDTRSGTTSITIESTGAAVTLRYRLADKYVFKVGGGLTVRNVIFDAIDSMDDDGQDPTDGDNECTLGASSLGATCDYVRNPTDYCPGGMYSGSFFEFDVTPATVDSADAPTLTIEDC